MRLVSVICSFSLITTFVLPASRANTSFACNQVTCIYLPNVSSAPPVFITQTELVGYRGGALVVQGEVMNREQSPIYDVMIGVRIYDETGQPLFPPSIGTTVLPAVLPGQLNPFEIDAGSYYTLTTPIQADTRIVNWSLSSTDVYHPVTVVSIQTTPCYHDRSVEVTADIRNDQMAPLTDVVVAVWSLGQSSRINTVQVAELAPREFVTIQSSVYYPEPGCAIKVSAQGRAAP